MKAITVKAPGGPQMLELAEWPQPIPGPEEILVNVKATALNRADLLQREGKYPPPTGASPLLGLELAGVVESVGENVSKWSPGDKVFGLLPGGGYAEYAVIHMDMALPIPDNLSFEQAAAIPEVFLTAYQALHWLGNLQKGETVLIHAGASGVGTAAIQLARQMQANVIVTASKPKHETCKKLGAAYAIDYKKGPFYDELMQATDGKGVDLIIDFIGADYFKQNLDSLKTDGRLVLLAALSGGKIESFDMRKILIKRIQLTGSTLRSRSLAYQIRLNQEFETFTLHKFKEGTLAPVIDRIYDWKEVISAHHYMEANKNTGKIVLSFQD